METIIDLGIINISVTGPKEICDIVKKYFPDSNFTGNCNVIKQFNVICTYTQKMISCNDYCCTSVTDYKGTIYKRYTKKDSVCAIHHSGLHMIQYWDDHAEIVLLDEQSPIWVVRLIRELIIRYVNSIGFFPFHASCVNYSGKGIVFIGDKGSGKSTGMITCISKYQATPVSNDLVLLGLLDDKLYALGWPMQVNLGDALLEDMGITPNLFVMKKNKKTYFYPEDFTKMFKTSWSWLVTLDTVLFPLIKIGDDINAIPLSNKIEYKKRIEQSVILYDKNNIFDINIKHSPQNIVEKIVSDVPAKIVTGDIWNNMRTCLLEEI